MTLENTLLENLGRWRFPPGERQTLTVDEAGWSATVSAECADTVGCRVWEVGLTRTTAATSPVDLLARAAEVANRVTGLLEPLKLLEVDAAKATALLRSETPRPSGDSVLYYEVLLGGNGSASARRYQAERTGGKRKQIAFTLTHEALAKLADDLAV